MTATTRRSRRQASRALRRAAHLRQRENHVGCAEVDHLAAGLAKASARLDYVRLNGVDHFLKEDISKNTASFNQRLPFSAHLRAALKPLLASNL